MLETELLAELGSPRELVRGNALVMLSLRPHPDVLPVALAILKDRELDVNLRQCAVLALMKAGSSDLVPELVAFLDRGDPLYRESLDSIGALSDESEISTVLPMLLAEGSILSAAFYHFREFRSYEALFQTLSFFATQPQELNSIRAEGYLEPILKLLPRYWDEVCAMWCVEILHLIDEQKIYPHRIEIIHKFFRAIPAAHTPVLVP